MSMSKLIITLIDMSCSKFWNTVGRIFVCILCVMLSIYLVLFSYQYAIKKTFPDAKRVESPTPWGNAVNEYMDNTNKVIELEYQRGLEKAKGDVNEQIKLEKSRANKYRMVTVGVASSTMSLPIAIDLKESLDNLKASDPNSKIIPLTEGFLLKTTFRDLMIRK